MLPYMCMELPYMWVEYSTCQGVQEFRWWSMCDRVSVSVSISLSCSFLVILFRLGLFPVILL